MAGVCSAPGRLADAPLVPRAIRCATTPASKMRGRRRRRRRRHPRKKRRRKPPTTRRPRQSPNARSSARTPNHALNSTPNNHRAAPDRRTPARGAGRRAARGGRPPMPLTRGRRRRWAVPRSNAARGSAPARPRRPRRPRDAELELERSVAPRRSQRGSGPTINSPGTAQKLPGIGPALRRKGKGGARATMAGCGRHASAGSAPVRLRARRVDVVGSVVVYRFVVVAAWGQDVGHRFVGPRGLTGCRGDGVRSRRRVWRCAVANTGSCWLRSSGRRASESACALVPYRSLANYCSSQPQRASRKHRCALCVTGR